MSQNRYRPVVSTLLLICLCISTSFSQTGGQSSFEFLRLPASARATALGGNMLSVSDGDISAAIMNPSIMDSSFHRQLAFNHNFHFAGISNGSVAYGHQIKQFGGLQMIAMLQYTNYGEFDGFDIIGQNQGTFSARETVFGLGAAKQLNERIRAGVTLKFANSSLETYTASALVADIGLYYTGSKPGTHWALILKNVGSQLSTYNNEERSVPTELQLAYSKKLQHLPFRLSIIAHHLNQWDIRYDDPDRQVESGIFTQDEESSGFSKTVDNLFRHLVFGGEFLFGKAEVFRLRFAYNHLLKKELEVSSFRSFGGFSFGFGLRIKKFRLDYARGNYHLAGSVNHLGLSIDLDSFFRKI